jgi:hypothetical protein
MNNKYLPLSFVLYIQPISNVMNISKIFTLLICLGFLQAGYSQCDLIIKYDESGNRIFRGNECDPECSTVVTNVEDLGLGTLRNAIFCAVDGDYITFDQTLDNETINLESGKITIDKSIQVNQSDLMYSPVDIDVKAQTGNVVFEILDNHTVVFQKVNMISHAGFDNNPRVLINHGSLTLQDLDLVDDGQFQNTNSTLLNTGALNIQETVKLIYVYYQ